MAEQAGGTLVGRERELGELLEGLTDAASGRGRLVLLAGEPGIGKSRLADELASRARELGHAVLWGRGWEDAGAPPFWPWVQALRSYLRSADREQVRRQLGSGAGDVVQMLPELRDLFPDLAQPSEANSDSARFQLFDSTTTFLRNAGQIRPLLVVLDDLQAADTPSILFLRFLASQLSEMRVLVVGTYRDVALTPDHPLALALDELTREPITKIIALGGLQAKAVGQFIGAATGITPDTRLVSAVWQETKGNPLFVGEALRLLAAQGPIDDLANLPALHISVPKGVREVMARRIGQVSDASARALVFGAALGPEFSVEVLRRVGDYTSDEPTELLDEAVRAGLLTPASGAGRYRFSHDLVRETLYRDLGPSRRQRLHRRIAEVLEELYGASQEPHLAELAFHFFEATQGSEPSVARDDDDWPGAKAIAYARRAADQASRSLAYEEAARLYRMALAVLDAYERPDDQLRTELLLAGGDAEARAGDVAAARATLTQAAEIARRTGAAGHLAQAALGYGGRLLWGRPGKDKRLIPMLQDALVLLGGSDEPLRVRLLARLACAWRSTPEQREQSATLSHQAVELARGLKDPATLSYALAGRYWATWWPENPQDRLLIAEEMVAVTEAAGDGERMIDAHMMLHQSYAEAARMAEARSELEDVTRMAHELREPAQLWLFSLATRTLMALMGGEFALAEDLVVRELEWANPITTMRDEVSAGRMHLFLLRREQARLAEVESMVRASVDEFPWYPLHRAALACLLLDLGRVDEGRTVFDDLAQEGFRALYRDSEWLLGMGLASDACVALGDAAAAAVLYEQLKSFTGRHAIGFAEGSLGAMDRCLGMLAATLGRLNEADAHLTEAIRLNEQMGARPWTAHSQHELALVLLRRDGPGDAARAAELLGRAVGTARMLGMTALEQRIEELDSTPTLAAAPIDGQGTFRKEGDFWTVAFGDQTVRIRHAKGMRHLARLLGEPGREMHALDLARMGAASDLPTGGESGDLEADGLGDAGAKLDPEAKASYRRRLQELEQEVAEADEWNDTERASRARREIEFLADELAGAVGLGGRDRKAASAAERARLSVTRAIRAAMARIAEASPSLGRHLETTIRTGTFCSYNPDPRVPIVWER